VRQATGITIRELPLTPEKNWESIQNQFSNTERATDD
jgi:hypothetical protein